MYSYEDRFCPLCNKEIDAEVCYEVVMCFWGGLKISSVPEVKIEKNEENKEICDKCPYSDLS